MPINPLINQLSDRARQATGRVMRGLSPIRRTKTTTGGVKVRSSEANIIGTDFVVSKQYTLSMIQDAQKNTGITKLELEDMLITEEEDGDKVDDTIFMAIKNLLDKDGDRKWKYIKFIDQIEIRGEGGDDYAKNGGVAQKLEKYNKVKELLSSQIDNHALGKPIMFLIKLVLHEETSLAQTNELLTALKSLPVARIEFGGALFQASTTTASRMLAELFNNNKEEHNNNNNNKSEGREPLLCLGELVMLTVTWAKGDSPSPRSKTLLEDCIGNLNRKQNGEKLLDSDSSTKDLDKSSNSNRNRGGRNSPKRAAAATRGGGGGTRRTSFGTECGRQPKRTKSLERLRSEMDDSSSRRTRQDRRRAAITADELPPLRRTRSTC